MSTDNIQILICALCGQELSEDPDESVVGSTGRRICRECVKAAWKINCVRDKLHRYIASTSIIKTPRLLVSELDKSIIGQSEAKTAIASALWKQQLRANGQHSVPHGSMLLYGPTGCGKTALVRQASALVGLPFMCFDATTLTEAGYKGMDAQDMISRLAEAYPKHPKLEYAVIFLDEADKLAAHGEESRAAYSRGTQHTLLKLIEGCEVKTGLGKTINTENLLFILGGAFTGLNKIVEKRCRPSRTIGFIAESCDESISREATTEDFIIFGMEPELMGRMTRRVQVNALSEEDMRRILLDSDISVLKKYRKFFASLGVDLRVSRKQIDAWIAEAAAMQSGARGLQSAVENTIEPMLVRLAERRAESEVVWRV